MPISTLLHTRPPPASWALSPVWVTCPAPPDLGQPPKASPPLARPAVIKLQRISWRLQPTTQQPPRPTLDVEQLHMGETFKKPGQGRTRGEKMGTWWGAPELTILSFTRWELKISATEWIVETEIQSIECIWMSILQGHFEALSTSPPHPVLPHSDRMEQTRTWGLLRALHSRLAWRWGKQFSGNDQNRSLILPMNRTKLSQSFVGNLFGFPSLSFVLLSVLILLKTPL